MKSWCRKPSWVSLVITTTTTTIIIIIMIIIMMMMMMMMIIIIIIILIIIIIAFKAQFEVCFTVANTYSHLPGRNCVQITCNTTNAYHVQRVTCHVVRRDSSAIKFDRV